MMGWEAESDEEDMFARVKKMRDSVDVSCDSDGDMDYSKSIVKALKKKKERNPPPTEPTESRKKNVRKKRLTNSIEQVSRIYSSKTAIQKQHVPHDIRKSKSSVNTRFSNNTALRKNKTNKSFQNSLRNKRRKELYTKKYIQKIEALRKRMKDKSFEHHFQTKLLKKQKKDKDGEILELKKEIEKQKENMSGMKQQLFKKTRQINLFFKSSKQGNSPNQEKHQLLPKISEKQQNIRTNNRSKNRNGNEGVSTNYTFPEIEESKLQKLRNIVEFQKKEKGNLILKLKRIREKYDISVKDNKDLGEKLSEQNRYMKKLKYVNDKLSKENENLKKKNKEINSKLGFLENEMKNQDVEGNRKNEIINHLKENLLIAKKKINRLEVERIRISNSMGEFDIDE